MIEPGHDKAPPRLEPAPELCARFVGRFSELAKARLARSMELLAESASAHAREIQGELQELVGEAALLELYEVLDLARRAADEARRIAEDPRAVIACTRAVRSLSRAVDGLEPRGEEPARAEEPQGPAACGRVHARVLVVDDSKLSADLLSAMLGDAGFAVASVRDQDGLEHALAAGRPDVVLCDVHMPGLDFAVVVRRVREAAPGARVLLISGLAEAVIERHCWRVSADGYVAREHGPAMILERVAAALVKRGR
jgi:CheY-like chemotaxis protein